MDSRLPLCVLVGKVNVGKSTLFNLFSGQRVTIVDSTPGVTRDWIERVVSVKGVPIRIVDTGGVSLGGNSNELQKHVEERVWKLVDKADLVLFVIDGREPLTQVDIDIAAILRKKNRPFFLVVNKREGLTHEPLPPEIFRLGGKRIFQISAKHGDGIPRLKEAIFHEFKDWKGDVPLFEGIPVAIVGKPNVGKSTLFNSLLGEERAIVSPIPGTTRDAIEVALSSAYGRYRLIDTAGLPRKRNIKDRITLYATFRTTERIADANLCILVLDPFCGVTRQDKKIAGEIARLGKCCIVFVNKVDLLEDKHPSLLEKLRIQARADLPSLYYAAFRVGSALDSLAVREELLPLMAGVVTRFHQAVQGDLLQGDIRQKINERFLDLPLRKRPHLKVLSQEGIAPPRFTGIVSWCEEDEKKQCARLIERVLREEIDWEGVPLRIAVYREGERVPQGVLGLPAK